MSSGQDRADSVKDLAEQIGEHHKDWLEVVATRTEADVIVEIVDRSSHQWRHHTRDKLKDGTLAMPIMGEYRVEAVIRRNDYNTPATGVGADVRATWRYAAADVADQLEDWTTDNYGKLPTLQK